MFGCELPVGTEARIYFGFRAIHQPARQEYMQLVHDRKTLKGNPTDEEKDAMSKVMDLLREQSKSRYGDNHLKVQVHEHFPAVGTVYGIGYASYGYFHGAIYIEEDG